MYPINTSIEVNRRFSDFDWLHKRLQTEFRGYLVPALPDKQLLNSSSPEFLEKRRQELEKFLNLLLGNAEFNRSSALRIFLTTPDKDFETAKQKFEVGFQLAIPNSAEEALDTLLNYVKSRISSFTRAQNPEILEIKHRLNVLRGPLKALYASQTAVTNA
jgi:sorting nexin-1/2